MKKAKIGKACIQDIRYAISFLYQFGRQASKSGFST
jgi:hypothetical protein